MSSWTCDNALYAHLLTPNETVVMRNLKDFARPPQAIVSVGVSLFNGSRQFSDCLTKTLGAETTAATNRRTQGRLDFSLQGLRILYKHVRDTLAGGLGEEFTRWGEAQMQHRLSKFFEPHLRGEGI